MPASFPRLTLRKMMLVIGLVAIPLSWSGISLGERRARCLEIASRLASLEQAYRVSAATWPPCERMADWNAQMRSEFERAASRPWEPIPKVSPVPPAWFK